MNDSSSSNRTGRASTDRQTDPQPPVRTDGGSVPERDGQAASTHAEAAEISDPAVLYDRVQTAVEEVVVGTEPIVEGLTIALLSRGHVLLEGVPGVAKTTVANAFSRALGVEYSRIQLTPDVLPTDITGTHVYREPTGQFELREGPIFGNVVLVDEINRAPPNTQAALLEAMQERQVTIGDETRELPAPFCLIATQNSIETDGTFELPAAQRDRFALSYTVELPDRQTEAAIIRQFDAEPELGPEVIEPAVTAADVLATRRAVAAVSVADPVVEYILDVVEQTRADRRLEHGSSPRGTLVFLNAAKARAAIDGRSYVLPDDIKTLARPVLGHRLVRNTNARMNGQSAAAVIDDLVESVPVPDADIESAVESQ